MEKQENNSSPVENEINESENVATDDLISEDLSTEEEIPNKVEKNSFKYKKGENGLILTIHHTIKEDNKLIRIRLVAGCFNDQNKHFVTVDSRGNIFVFDLARKKHWKLGEKIQKASIIRNVVRQQSLYLIGTKNGSIHWVDVDKSTILRSGSYSSTRIINISFPGIPLTPSLAIINSNQEAMLLNLETYEASHRLEFNQNKISLKFVSYVPQSDQIFTCFTNDSVHIWSGITLNTIRMHNPIRIRDRFLASKAPQTIQMQKPASDSEFEINCNEVKEYSRGLINSYAFSPDGSLVCFSTLDSYVMFHSSVSFDLLKLIKFEDATLRALWLFSKPNDNLILCHTTKLQLTLIDMEQTDFKLIVEDSNCFRADASKNRQLLYTAKSTGEINVFNALMLIDSLKSARSCSELLRTAMTQPKALSVNCLDKELKKILSRKNLIPILKEYGQYPSKYRNVIWAALLDLPCNKARFQELVKMGTHPTAAAFNKSLQLKDSAARRNLIKIFSCLAHWTKVNGYCDFLPGFIFPFVKVLANSLIICFETLVSILMNQCQLWFEFHPLEPLNYLGMCENVLNHFDTKLVQFYLKNEIPPKLYAWKILSSGFSEVLDDEQWLCFWDNVLSNPPYFLLFCVVAYNLVLREIIIRLKSKEVLEEFFQEQNPVDISKLLKKAYSLMEKCPEDLHPKQYMTEFAKLPKGVYPKFENYPKKWVDLQEKEMEDIRREHEAIDARIRKLEKEEAEMMDRLQRGLQQEEYAKRMKEMQKQYEEILKREEERLAYQRKMLLLYQKELRNRKGKVVELLQKSARKRKENLQETEIDVLLRDIDKGRRRNEIDLTLAEEQIKDQELIILSQKFGVDDMLNGHDYEPLRRKYKDAIDRLDEEKQNLTKNLQKMIAGNADASDEEPRPSRLSQIELIIQELENEFRATLAS